MPRLRTWMFVIIFLVLSIAGGISLWWSGPSTAVAAPAAELDAPTASITLKPTADAYVISSRPSDNFGSATDLVVASEQIVAVINAHTLLRFDLSEIPVGSTIERAILTLHQRSATNEKEWPLTIRRITQSWSDTTVTFRTLPPSDSTPLSLISRAAPDIEVATDLTQLVRQWHYQPLRYPNYGLLLGGTSLSANRIFDSGEGRMPPTLKIEYTPPPSQVTVPYTTDGGELDAVCDVEKEYANALRHEYIDHEGNVSVLYLKQDDSFFYSCIEGVPGTFALRYFGLYLDRDNGQEKYAEPEDYALHVRVIDGAPASYIGTGASTNTWEQVTLDSWRGLARPADNAKLAEVAEFQVPLGDLATTCGQPFGLALYHQWVTDNGVDYGWPTETAPFSPSTWVEATLERPQCPIQVCFESAAQCQAATGATVHVSTGDSTYSVNRAGYVIDREQIADGTQIWATLPVSVTDAYTLYYTSGAPQTVSPAAYGDEPAGQMTLVISRSQPLMLHNIDVAAQWNIESNVAYTAKLRDNLIRASEFFYDFTNGQMALGTVTVYQNYEKWDAADVWLFANNNLRPEAEIGGTVETPTVDLHWDGTGGKHKLVYDPGRAYMGATWNRYGLPGVPERGDVDTSDDWAAVFAHELGHYLLFLDDTYYRFNNNFVIEAVYDCTGSAMGWVYFDENSEFVFDDKHWLDKCQSTASNAQLQRDEWATIKLWYKWVVEPTLEDLGPDALPAGVTKVQFVSPTGAQPSLNDQLFNLDYRDNETASAEARALIFRDDRVIDQGKPSEGTTKIELHGAQEGDRFCVIDINDKAISPQTPRNQYGCEKLTAGDQTLFLEKDTAWAPIVTIDPTTPTVPGGTTLVISVTQPLGDNDVLKARLYPEHQQGSTEITLDGKDSRYRGIVDLPFTPAAYVQLYVDEFEAPDGTDPRREAIVDFGVGGGGLPGPTSNFGWAPIISSSDGRAFFVVPPGLALESGQFIALQSMAGTPPLPDDFTVVDQSYRLIAYPKSLVTNGSINIRFTADLLVQGASAGQGDKYRLYFWDGVRWQPLKTTLTTEPDGNQLASAASQGVGIYALLTPKLDTTNPETDTVYLPLIQR